ncbi:MAG: hypothetical protein ACR2I2_09435 [Bryobacteraceae bacterium]
MDSPKVQKATKKHLRDLFNAEGFYSNLNKNTTHTVLCYDDPAPQSANEPPETMSQVHDYIDSSGNKLATIHRYRRKDGTLGASGKLDPHSLLLDGVLLFDP